LGNFATVIPLDPLPPLVTSFVAESGIDSAVPYSFTVPTGVDECRVMRRPDQFPLGVDDGAAALVMSFTAPGITSGTDEAVVNDTAYFFAAFCRDGTRWNNEVVEGSNAQRATPSLGPVCSPSDTMTVGRLRLPDPCDHAVVGDTGILVAGLRFETDCDNELESLTFTLHPSSTANEKIFAEVRLYRDENENGRIGMADTLLARGTFSGRGLTFDGFSDPIAADSGAAYLIEADFIDEPVGTQFVALQVLSEDAIQLAGRLQRVVFSGVTPLDSKMITVTDNPRVCVGNPRDFGDGSFAATQAVLKRGQAPWEEGAGDDADWSVVLTAADQLANCEPADPSLLVSDEGTSSQALRIELPAPAGLPVESCALNMRLYATSYSGSDNCDHEPLTGMKRARLFTYTSATAVNPTPQIENLEDASSGPEVADECESHFFDADL
ncbi:MAG: hypothetical protein AAF658_19480, partial [Myxococcota bacterium]